jgi:CubicO group peptidase (beta-lactamase class C family)
MVNAELQAQNPEAVGLDPEKVALLLDRVERDVRDGVLPSAQIALARNGKLAVMRTFGRVKHEGVEAAARDETLFCVFSCTKAMTAVLVWQLMERGQLKTDERVGSIVPELASSALGPIAVEQLLTHTAGFPNAPFDPVDFLDRDKRLARLERFRLEWPPGSRFEYHASSSMYVVAEILEQRTGRTYAQLVRERIAAPLALDELWVGLPRALHARLADVEHVGEPPSEADYAKLGMSPPNVGEVTEDALTGFNRAEVREAGIPAGGGTMGAAEIALFYQGLVEYAAPRDKPMLCAPETVREACAIRTGSFIDPTTGQTANRGLGVSIAGDAMRGARGFGKTCSALTFGHGGAGGQLGWADPVTGISIGYCTSGHDRNPLRRARRNVAIGSLAASCLR